MYSRISLLTHRADMNKITLSEWCLKFCLLFSSFNLSMLWYDIMANYSLSFAIKFDSNRPRMVKINVYFTKLAQQQLKMYCNNIKAHLYIMPLKRITIRYCPTTKNRCLLFWTRPQIKTVTTCLIGKSLIYSHESYNPSLQIANTSDHIYTYYN